MSTVVLLDSGPLGMVTNPRASQVTEECNRWLESLLSKGMQVVVPEIADYELRRELLRAEKTKGIARLDQLEQVLDYLPINTEMMRKAAEFWAAARRQGKATAPDVALDGDAILAAQAAFLTATGEEAIIATTNVGHLSLFVEARKWQEVR